MKSIITHLSARFLIPIFIATKKTTNANIKNSNSEEKQEKVKIVVTGDSMLNGMNGKGLSKSRNVKGKNYPGATSEDILDKTDGLLKVKPDCLLAHAGTNDLTNNVNLLKSVKKMVKKVKNSSLNIKLVFSFTCDLAQRKKGYLEESW